MRIVGGHLKGRRLQPPLKKWPTRPTTDFAREALFNILEQRITWDSTRMLDLFGGTGAISLEAASRGCEDITYVDRYYPCIEYVKRVASELEVDDQITVVKRDVIKFLSSVDASYDLIFMDPPYDMQQILSLPSKVFDNNILADGGTLIIEHASQTDMTKLDRYVQHRKYGSSTFTFFA